MKANLLYYSSLALILCAIGCKKTSTQTAAPQKKSDEATLTLHEAAQVGDIESVRGLLAKGVDVNAGDKHSRTPLHMASYDGHVELAELLIGNGADVDADGCGFTPLFIAAEGGHIDLVELLLKKGADLRTKGPDALSGAIRKGHTGVVRMLIDHGTEISSWQLHNAAKNGHRDILELLVAEGADLNVTGAVGQTLLHEAAETGHRDVAEFLIASGADVNARDDWDESTPLHKAAESGRRDVAEILITNGADINAMAQEGRTPLHEAFFGGYLNVIELLIARGADVNAEDKGRKTPLHEAAGSNFSSYADDLLEAKYAETHTNGQQVEPSLDEQNELARILKMKAVKLLIGKGADVNARDYLGGTPLHDAMIWVSTDTVKILLESGANPNVQDAFGSILLYEVIAEGFPDIVQLFLDHGADVNMVDTGGQTPLHEAVWNDRKDVAEIIIDKGAEVNAADRNGDTPLHVVALNGHSELYDLLVTKGGDVNAKNKQGKTPVDYADSPASREAVILSEDNEKPYSVIITNLKHIRQFLKSEMIDFDQIWIPEKSDIDGLMPALREGLKKETIVVTDIWFDRAYVLANLDKYNREYAGFFKDGTAYAICNMSLGIDENPRDNLFTSVYDGGSSFLRVIFDPKRKEVVQINCNGM